MARKPRYTALIADLVASRKFQGTRRQRLQDEVSTLLKDLNRAYRQKIVSKFVITAGDEFQGLLGDPTCIPDIIWDVEMRLDTVSTRVGIGYGALDTQLNEFASGMDGPVWHKAREALTESEKSHGLGGVFRGFGEKEDDILNALSKLLRSLRARLSAKQRLVLDLLRKSPNQAAVAVELGITPQAVSKQARSAGWDAYKHGEAAWRVLLEAFQADAPRRRP